MNKHRAWLTGAVLVVLATGCASSEVVGLEAASSDDSDVSVVAATSIPTTAALEPAPSPTALTIDVPNAIPTPVPTAAVSATPAPKAVAPATAIPATAAPANPPESPSSQPTAPPPATAAPVAGSQQVLAANGAEVFTLNCARCHGENGLGSQQYSAGLIGVGARYSTAGMIAELTTGHPVTFGFADRLSAEEIASVVAYVKSAFP